VREREDVGACNSVLSDQNMVCMYFKKSNAVTLDKKVFFGCVRLQRPEFLFQRKRQKIFGLKRYSSNISLMVIAI